MISHWLRTGEFFSEGQGVPVIVVLFYFHCNKIIKTPCGDWFLEMFRGVSETCCSLRNVEKLKSGLSQGIVSTAQPASQ